MAELQRSVTSFRRVGSSGLVWKDHFLSASHAHNHPNNLQQQGPPHTAPLNHRSRSTGSQPYGGGGPVNISLPPKEDRPHPYGGAVNTTAPLKEDRPLPYGAVNITTTGPPKEDPPSPKVSTCCFFGKQQPVSDHRATSKSKKRR